MAGAGNALLTGRGISAGSALAFPFWGSPVITNPDGTLSCPGFEGNTYATNVWDYMVIGGLPNPGLTPGICKVRVKRDRAYDEKKAAGTDGARVTMHGLNLAKVNIQIIVWTPEQYRVLQAIWKSLLAPAYKTNIQKRSGLGSTTTAGFTPDEKTSTTAGTTGAVSGATITIPQIIPPGAARNTNGTITSTTKQTVSTIATFSVSHPECAFHSVRAIQIIDGQGPEDGPILRSKVFTIEAIEFLKPGTANATNTPVQALGSNLDPDATINYPLPTGTGP